MTCHQQNIDRYNRVIALCEADGLDVGGDLVEQGPVIAHRYFGGKYFSTENWTNRARHGCDPALS